MPPLAPFALLLALATGSSPQPPIALPPLPRAHIHEQLLLPLRGADAAAPSPQRLLLVADAGHSANRSAHSICAQIGAAFLTEGLLAPAACRARIAASVRAARGLAAQHAPSVAAGVAAMESYLGEEGHADGDWEGANGAWLHPYKARFLHAALARAPRGANACAVGFGTGHTALVLLAGATAAAEAADGSGGGGGGGGGGSGGGVRVFSFDRATGRAAIPAQDFLEARYPDRNMLFLGDPPLAMQRFLSAFPATKCALLLVDPNALQPLLGNATAQALRALAALAAPAHTLVLTSPLALPLPADRKRRQQQQQQQQQRIGEAPDAAAAAPAGAPPGEAWEQAHAAGWLAWEGTLLAAPEQPQGDRLYYGAFAPDALDVMRRTRLPVEEGA